MFNVTASLSPISDHDEQIRVAAYGVRREARERFGEPVDQAELDRLLEISDAAWQEVTKLGDALFNYVAIRNRCLQCGLDDDLRIAAQKLIDELQPKHELAKATHIAAKDAYLGCLMGRKA